MLHAEDLIRNNDLKEYFDIYEPSEQIIILGRSRNAEEDVYIDKCSEDNIKIIQRISGGGTVLLSPGMLVWTLLIPTKTFCLNQTKWFKAFSEWIINILTNAGIKGVKMMGSSDIVLGNKKICGTALYIGKNRILYHGTLLIDIDISLFEKYLKIPDRMPEYRNKRPHSEFVTTLQAAGYNKSKSEIINLFKESKKPSENDYLSL